MMGWHVDALSAPRKQPNTAPFAHVFVSGSLKIGIGSMTTDIKSALIQVFTHDGRGDGRCLPPSASLPSSYQLHRQAERDRNLVMNALLRSATRQFAKWLAVLAHGAIELTRELMDEWRRRREIRLVLRFDDRALADMGLGRSEIESVVRTGRHLANQASLPQRRLHRTSAGRQAV